MGSIMDPHPSQVIASAERYKEQSLLDPDGVQYMDHLWELIKNEKSLQVVLRTDDVVFDDVSVRIWWSYGNYDWEEDTEPENSALMFDIPDEVWRRIQSQHAAEVMRRWFGQTTPVELEAPFRAQRDSARKWEKGWGEHDTHEVIVDDWLKLKRAIKLTATDGAMQLGGQALELYSYRIRGAKARVQDGQLQIYIGASVPEIIETWTQALERRNNPTRH